MNPVQADHYNAEQCSIPSLIWCFLIISGLLAHLLMVEPAQAKDAKHLQLLDPLLVVPLGINVEVWQQTSDERAAKDVFHGEADISWQRQGSRVTNIGFSDSSYWFRVQINNLAVYLDWYMSIDLPLIAEFDVHVMAQAALGSFRSMADSTERRRNRIRCSQALPVLGREVIEGHQLFSVLLQALNGKDSHKLVMMCWLTWITCMNY